MKELPYAGSRQQFALADSIADALGLEKSSPAWALLNRLVVEQEADRYSLDNKLASMQRDVERVRKLIRAPKPILNTLGEIQNSISAVEAAVGAFAASQKALAAFMEEYGEKKRA